MRTAFLLLPGTFLLSATTPSIENTPGRQASATNYSRTEAAVLKTDTLIRTDPRPFFKNVESMIIVEDGHVKFEAYYNGVERNGTHQLQSQTKSVMAILLGIAIDKGYIKDEYERLSNYFPEQFNDKDRVKATVTIRDLVTMSAGFRWEEWNRYEDPDNDNRKMFESGTWLGYALSRPMAQKPNTGFKYNSGCPIIVAALIEKATRMSLEAFAAKVLFEPLGIEGYRWIKDSTGLCHAGGGLFLKPYDMVKIGIVVLNGGRWNDTRTRKRGSGRPPRLTSPPASTTAPTAISGGYGTWIFRLARPRGWFRPRGREARASTSFPSTACSWRSPSVTTRRRRWAECSCVSPSCPGYGERRHQGVPAEVEAERHGAGPHS